MPLPTISDQALQDLLDTGAIDGETADLRESLLRMVEHRLALDCALLQVQAEHARELAEIRAGQQEILRKLGSAA